MTAPQVGPLPLTAAQLGIWFAHALDPSHPGFECAEHVELSGHVDVETLCRATDQALAEADGLRVRFEVHDGVPHQRVLDVAHAPRTRVVDLRGRADDDVAARAWMDAQVSLARSVTGPHADLVDSVVLRLRSRDLWFLRIHHLLADAYAFALLENRAARIYGALVRGTDAPAARTPSLADLVADDEAYAASPARSVDEQHWGSVVDGAPNVVRLGRVAASAPGRHRVTGTLPPSATDALRAAADASGVSWLALVAAVAADQVGATTGRTDVVLGLPLTGRGSPTASRAVATRVAVHPLRLDADPRRPLAALAADAEDALRSARTHQRCRPEAVPRADGSPVPPWTRAVRLNLKPFDTALRFGDLTGRVHPLAAGPVEDVEITVGLDDGALLVVVDANPAACSRDDAAAHLARLLDRLRAAGEVLRRDGRAGDLPLATPLETAALALCNATDERVEPGTLADLLADALDAPERPGEPGRSGDASRPGEASALAWESGELSRAGLAGASRALAHRLVDAGAGPGDVVAVAAERGPALVVALLAVLEAGAAYLPLDVDAPAARAHALLDLAAPVAVVADDAVLASELGAALRMRGDVVHVPHPDPRAADVPAARPPRRRALRPDDPAYVLFTSGSTGAPKGVVVPHAGIVNRLAWMQGALGLTPDDVVLQKTPVTFDVSVWELFWPLLAGATLALAPPGAHRDPAAITAAVRRHGVTTAHFVPSMLRAQCAHLGSDDDARSGVGTLRQVVCSGEALDPVLVRQVHGLVPGARLHNLYGPTEASIDVSWWDCGTGAAPEPLPLADPGDPAGEPFVPLGTPVWNTRLAVLDAAGREVPPGAVGELCIAGVQLATGYLGRPDLTAEQFVTLSPGPGGTTAPTRWYRTGDQARWHLAGPDVAGGVLEYLGREDRQVKVRGQRVELGEVEAHVVADPGVQAATVTAVPDAAGDLRLVALVVVVGDGAGGASDHRPAAAAQVRARLVASVPAMLIPHVVVVDALPTSRHGKLDRAGVDQVARDALTGPGGGAGAGQAEAGLVDAGWALRAGPFTAGVRAAVADVLGHDVAAEDSFFAVGGDSLKAARLTTVLTGLGPGTVELADVFGTSCVGDLVDVVAGRSATGSALDVVLPLRPRGAEVVACVHPAGGLAWCYAPLLRHLPDDVALLGVQSPAYGAAVANTGSGPAGAAGSGSAGAATAGTSTASGAPSSIDGLGALYAARLAAVAGDRPVHLVGWSVGGVLAHATAAHADDHGLHVASLTLLDAYPADAWSAVPPPDDVEVARALATMGGLDADALARATTAPEGLTVEASLAALRTAGSPLALLPDAVLTTLPDVVDGHVRAMRAHVEPRVDVPTTVVVATAGDGPVVMSEQTWAHAVDEVRLVRFDGGHADLVAEHGVALVAGLLPVGRRARVDLRVRG